MKEKQIEEMASEIFEHFNCRVREEEAERIANHLVNAGYHKQKEGKWKLNKDGSGTCSECGITQKSVWDYDNWQNFCGHCGAKMTTITTKG